MIDEASLDPHIRALLGCLSENERDFRFLAPRPEFQSLCEAYVTALEAKEAWSDKPDVAHQFWCIAVEIEDEFRLLLASPRAG